MRKIPRWKIEIETIDTLKTVYAHALTDTPEEDAWKKIRSWAEPKGLLTREKGTRVFGRNTYPTDNPEPHGYELYITVNEQPKPETEIMVGEIPGGIYAILKSTNLKGMASAWPSLWKWVEESEYEFTGWMKGEHGWVNGYEEHLNPFDEKTPSEWRFNLMIPLKKK
jgi:DNA gyrase inhibitor GyrI